MIESLHIDPTAQPTPSQRRQQADADSMDMEANIRLASTQPETPLTETPFDWERPPRLSTSDGHSASQPTHSHAHASSTQLSATLLDRLAEDPSMSQFSQKPAVPLSLTQAARRFGDIVPAHSLARFLSALPLDLVVPLVVDALHRLGVPAAPVLARDCAYVRVTALDGRRQAMKGTILVEPWNEEVVECRFVKAKADPLEWRRFFKRVVALCKDAVLVL